jgi:hypothetical protein
MQETQNRIVQYDQSSLPTRIRVIGYTYLVDFGPSTQPRFHAVNKQRSCSGLGQKPAGRGAGSPTSIWINIKI